MAKFDAAAFDERRTEVVGRDPQWKELGEELQRHNGEEGKCSEAVKKLEDQKSKANNNESKQAIELELKLKKLEERLANSKWWKTYNQRLQRGSELERDLLLQDLKTATNDDMKIEIQRRLEKAEGKIHEWKEWINKHERQVNEYEGELKEDSKPTLEELFSLEKRDKTKINIIKKMSPGWYDLGVLMNFDVSGTKLEIIKEKHHSDPVSCCHAMFQHWLNGNGRKPTSWRTLIKLLEDSDEEVLAEEVRN